MSIRGEEGGCKVAQEGGPQVAKEWKEAGMGGEEGVREGGKFQDLGWSSSEHHLPSSVVWQST